MRRADTPRDYSVNVTSQNYAIAATLRNGMLRAASMYFAEAEQLRENELPHEAAKRVLDEMEERPALMRFLSQAVTQVPLDMDPEGRLMPEAADEDRIAMALAAWLHRKNRDGDPVIDAEVVSE
jgi:hypothetical protein